MLRNAGRFERSVTFPGIPTTCDGSAAIVWVESHITQAACAYPITPSTNMGGGYSAAASNGQKNLWGDPIEFIEPESEHSAASACEGFALAGGRVVNFTSGQGLILMKEVLYTISGKRLPIVFHIGARALTSHSLNVHGGHDDVMGVADAGWCILFARNAQEAADLSLIARRAAETSSTPFMVCQDGFLTTHTVENIRLPETEFMKQFVGKPEDRIINLFDPARPLMTGVVQDSDAYMKGKIAQRAYIQHCEPAIAEAMDDYGTLTGRQMNFVECHQMDDAEYALVGMGSMMETAMPTVDWIREHLGIKVGVVHVTCYRPFPSAQLVRALRDVKGFTVLERMDDPLAPGNPLLRDIKSAFVDARHATPEMQAHGVNCHKLPRMFGASAGLGGRDVRPGHFISLVNNMIEALHDRPYRSWVSLGIEHETALPMGEDPDVRPAGAFSMRGHSIGGFGSVTTNKIIADLCGDLFGLSVQAYPKYGSAKKGLPTTYFLTVAGERLKTHCELQSVELIALNDTNAFNLGDCLAGLSDEGTLFMHHTAATPNEAWASVPTWARQRIREKNARVFFLDTMAIAREVAHNPALRVRMMGVVLVGVFLKVTPFAHKHGMSVSALMEGVEKAIRDRWGKKGEQVVQDNLTCIKRGYEAIQQIPQELVDDKTLDTTAGRVNVLSA